LVWEAHYYYSPGFDILGVRCICLDTLIRNPHFCSNLGQQRKLSLRDELPLVCRLLLLRGVGTNWKWALELGKGELAIIFHARLDDRPSVQLNTSARLDWIDP